MDNAIVVVENPVSDEQLEHLKRVFNKEDIRVTGGYLNNLQLRASNELARHKLLDLLGDFALLGMRIKGRVWASRPGHYANTEFMKQLLLMLISFYQRCISPAFPGKCRFRPTCSQYAIEAIEKYGVIKGAYLALRRILRCHPWGGHGYDPVP